VIAALTTLWLSANVKRGTAVFNGGWFVNVVFMEPFDHVPKVVITPIGATTKIFYVASKSVAGFRIATSGNATIGIDWIAISP